MKKKTIWEKIKSWFKEEYPSTSYQEPVKKCYLLNGNTGHFSPANWPNCHKCGACGHCGRIHNYYSCPNRKK